MSLSILCFNKTYFLEQLAGAGHRVLIAGVREEQAEGRPDAWSQTRVDLFYETGEQLTSIFNRLPRDFFPDRIVYFDDSYPPLRVYGWEKASVPTLFYSIDAHIHVGWHSIISGVFDTVLIAQKDYVPAYSLFAPSARWFPLWAPKEFETHTTRDIEVCFRGSLDPVQRASRISFLSDVAREVPLDWASGRYEEVFCRSKIILNEAIHDDVNYRVFEAVSCGGMLLTPRLSNGLLELFIDGEEIVTYEKGNAHDAAEKCRFYLKHGEKRAAIAEQGLKKLKISHSVTVRGNEFERLVRENEVRAKPTLFYSSAYQALFSGKVRLRTSVTHGAILQNLIASVQRKERYDSTFAFMLLRLLRESNTSLQQNCDLLVQAITSFPHEPAVVMIGIWYFTKNGQNTAAKELCLLLSDDTEGTLRAADDTVQMLLETAADV